MREWVIAIVMLGVLVAVSQLSPRVGYTIAGIGAALLWYLMLTSGRRPHSRRWEDVKRDGQHHRDFPPSSR